MHTELTRTLAISSLRITLIWAVIYLLEYFTLLGLGGIGRKEGWKEGGRDAGREQRRGGRNKKLLLKN